MQKSCQFNYATKILIFLLSSCLIIPVSFARELQGPASDFTLKSRQGNNIKLSEQRGNVIMINFWASWCGPCRQEMPLLDAMYKRYSPMGFTILGINVEEDSSKAEHILKDIPVDFPILYDRSNKVSKLYNLEAMPSTIFVDRNGNMRYLHRGYKSGDEAEYEEWIKRLIRE